MWRVPPCSESRRQYVVIFIFLTRNLLTLIWGHRRVPTRGESRRGLPRCKSRLLLCNKNSPVLPTSTLRKSQKNKLQQHLTFRPPFQRRQNPKTASLVAPRTERNLFFHRSAGGEAKQSGGLFWRGEPSPGVPRCALAHNKSRLLLRR